MAGNNSCGGKSIRYGLMADNVRAIDALLADGSRHVFGENAPNTDLVARLHALGEREAAEIAEKFPHQLRRVGGYNLEALTPDARAKGAAISRACWWAARARWPSPPRWT
jgi:FAD/FMN-containing dehydrogenase